jgi:hypothetical protein
MDQCARVIAVTALAGGDPARAAALARQVGTSPQYWNLLPKDDAALARYAPLLVRLNAAADAQSAEYKELLKLVE